MTWDAVLGGLAVAAYGVVCYVKGFWDGTPPAYRKPFRPWRDRDDGKGGGDARH